MFEFRPISSISITFSALFLSIAASGAASAQCTDFARGFTPSGVDGGYVEVLALHDDGSGTSLYAGGSFITAGAVVANSIARWDGAAWHGLGSGIVGAGVFAITSADLGAGPRLYAGGAFTSAGGAPAINVAMWNGSAWSALGASVFGNVTSLVPFDDGAGVKLYAGTEYGLVMRWNGTAWSQVGAYFTPTSPGALNQVRALAVFDDGTGPALFAGGAFTGPGLHIARWDGASWIAVGSGVDGNVLRLRTLDNGTGPALYACGSFANAGGLSSRGVARWTGSSWEALAGLGGGTVYDIGFGTDGSAAPPALEITGSLSGVTHLAKRFGATWAPIGEGLRSEGHALAHFDPGMGSRLVVGGWFQSAGSVAATAIVERHGSAFHALHEGLAPNATVQALATYDSGNGPDLYVGGSFETAGALTTWGLARFDGESLHPLPAGGLTSNVTALAVHDDGSGPALFVAQYFDLAKWNGTTWSHPGGGLGSIDAFLTYDDGSGPLLYAGGGMSGKVQRWNGATWTIVGGTLPHRVWSLASGNLGAGQRLFAGTVGGGGPGVGLYQWDGGSWSVLAGGVSGYARTLALFDDGSGLALYVGGGFLTVGGSVSASYIARFNGASWSAVGGGMNAAVQSLRVYDDGSGPKLYAGGGFTLAGGVPVKGFARWDGIAWVGLGEVAFLPTLAGSVSALEPFDDGSGTALYLGGAFHTAGTQVASNLAKWSCAPDRGARTCSGDGLDPYVVAACPCANFGALGHGCGNSVNAAGAELMASSGSVSSDDLVLTCTGMPATTTALFVKGTSPITGAVVFGDGLRCVGGSVLRLATKSASGGSASFPAAGDPSLATRGATAIGSGVTAWYQVYYRNLASFCTSAPFNLSNGWRIRW